MNIAQKLLDRGIDINLKNQQGMTPLMEAVIESRTQMIRFLHNNRADMELKDKKERTAFILAILKMQTSKVRSTQHL